MNERSIYQIVETAPLWQRIAETYYFGVHEPQALARALGLEGTP